MRGSNARTSRAHGHASTSRAHDARSNGASGRRASMHCQHHGPRRKRREKRRVRVCVEYVQRAEGVGTEGTDAEWQRDLTEEGIEPHPGPRVLSKNVRGISTVTKFTKFIQAARREADARPYAALLVQETNITGQRNASELASKAAYKKMIMISAHARDVPRLLQATACNGESVQTKQR